jgi:hypothetical protein
MIYAVLALAATNMATVLALVVSLRQASQERRILFAASLEANGATDAARRAASPTMDEAKGAVEQQLKRMAEVKENGGVFSASNPFGSVKPEGV